MSSAKQSLFKELDLDEPQWDVFSMTYDALQTRLAEATAFGVECQRALETERAQLAELRADVAYTIGAFSPAIDDRTFFDPLLARLARAADSAGEEHGSNN